MSKKNLLDWVKDLSNNTEEKTTTRKLNNDLLVGKKDYFTEAKQAFKILKLYGFSSKTVKLTTKYNIQLKKDFDLNDLEYLIFISALNESQVSLQTIIRLSGENSPSALAQTFAAMFNMFNKNIFGIYPGEAEVYFKLSMGVIEYLYNHKKFNFDSDKSLKKIIYEIDTIANLYNAIPFVSNIGEQHILALLVRYQDQYDYCKVLKEIFEESSKNSFGRNDPYFKFVFYILGHLVINSHDFPSIDRNHPLIEYFVNSNPIHESIVNSIFLDERHPLFQKKIFDHAIDESGKADKNSIELHADFKRKYVKNIIKEVKHDDVIKAINIPKKEFFFNSENKEKIDELTEMLSMKSFSNIKKRLSKAGTRTGFIILFSGVPGTGKTSYTLEIARKTGRDIIKVDMSSIRSKWWGEDEKNIKSIFTNYKSILQDSKIEPILLLNEADAIIGKRLDVAGNNGAIISSINATQNIILDAFDDFEGILIATTNLTKNFDSAFERRFLYKIEFEKPNIETRSKILESMLKIPEEDSKIIATQFDLSGGNIENIYRKMTTRKILYGEPYSLDRIISLCKDEKIQKEASKIGFGH